MSRARTASAFALISLMLLSVPFSSASPMSSGSQTSLTLAVNPDGSVGVSLTSVTQTMNPPGTVPGLDSHVRAVTSGGTTVLHVNETETIPASEMKVAPFNYSNTFSSMGSFSNGVSKGSLTLQSVPGLSTPASTFKANYMGDANSISISGNATIQYGTYGTGSGKVVVNETTVSAALNMARNEGINKSTIQKFLMNLPGGGYTLQSFDLNATYGPDSAFVNGEFQMTGNMTALPIYLAQYYYNLTAPSTTTFSQVSVTTTSCNSTQPGTCLLTLYNTGTVSSSITGCILFFGGQSYLGTVTPSMTEIVGGGHAQVLCSLPQGTAGGSDGEQVTGELSLNSGASIVFTGTWSSTASTSTSTSTTTSSTTQTTTQSKSVQDLKDIATELSSAFHSYSYQMSYSSGILSIAETINAAENLNLDQLMPLFGSYAMDSGAPASTSNFISTTKVDIRSLSEDLSSGQAADGLYTMNLRVSGITIHPAVTVKGGTFNESALFHTLATSAMGTGNVTIVGGASGGSQVNIVAPAGTPPPTSVSSTSKTWGLASVGSLTSLQFTLSTTTISTTTTSSSTTAGTTSGTSSTSGGGGGVPEFPVSFALALGFTAIILASYLTVRRVSLRRIAF